MNTTTDKTALLIFSTASPITLASLISDVDCLGTGASSEQIALRNAAAAELYGTAGRHKANCLMGARLDAGDSQSPPLTINGRLVEAGDDVCGNPCLTVAVDRRCLRDLPSNIVFRDVSVAITQP